ncbi:MAG: hypothetical protein R2788_18245 [Saprospiraceae bacterium]
MESDFCYPSSFEKPIVFPTEICELFGLTINKFDAQLALISATGFAAHLVEENGHDSSYTTLIRL